jgi:hypothetical protein
VAACGGNTARSARIQKKRAITPHLVFLTPHLVFLTPTPHHVFLTPHLVFLTPHHATSLFSFSLRGAAALYRVRSAPLLNS